MKRLTTFSFGYDGWGNSTEQLVKAVDAVEKGRGFRSPIFVDVRIRRQVRAKGFVGPAFENLLGAKRHRWMQDLGNEAILTRTGRGIQIRRPAAANELLELAREANENDRRVIFFCSCPWPRCAGKIGCHRTTVGTLLLGAARRQEVRLEVVEWPGGPPQRIGLNLAPELFAAVQKGRASIPLPNPRPLANYAGLPWGSIATLRSDGQSLHRVVGPAKWGRGQWVLPVLAYFLDPETGLASYKQRAESCRRSNGLTARSSMG